MVVTSYIRLVVRRVSGAFGAHHQPLRMAHMKRLLPLLLFLSCIPTDEPQLEPRRGKIAVDIIPNPIVAKPVSGDVYEFPFEVSLREVGGVEIEIETLEIDVTMLGGLRVLSSSYGPEEIEKRGYSKVIPAGGNLQYRFVPRRRVTNELLFTAVTAEITVAAIDRIGNRTEAMTKVTVTR